MPVVANNTPAPDRDYADGESPIHEEVPPLETPRHRARVHAPIIRNKARPGPAEAILRKCNGGNSDADEIALELYYGCLSVAAAEEIAREIWTDESDSGSIRRRALEASARLRVWLDRGITGRWIYVFLQAITLRQGLPGGDTEMRLMAAMGVDVTGHREVLAVLGTESTGESWPDLLLNLKDRGLRGTRLFVGGNEPGVADAVQRYFPTASYQGSLHHLEQQLLLKMPAREVHWVMAGFDAMRAGLTRERALAAADDLGVRLHKAGALAEAALLESAVHFQFSYLDFPCSQWARLSNPAPLRKVLARVRTRLRAIGPVGNREAVVLLAAARMSQAWSARRPRRGIDFGQPAG